MVNLDIILNKEANNQNSIYLYQRGGKWFAYERSAYNFSHLFDIEDILQTEPYICISINGNLEFLDYLFMQKINITSVGNDHIEILCKSNFTGFDEWKRRIIDKHATSDQRDEFRKIIKL